MSVKLLTGDCRVALATLPERSVQTVITSPPYWGLRDYGTDPLVWGGDAEHAHEWGEPLVRRLQDGTASPKQSTHRGNTGVGFDARSSECACGAWLGSLGLEPTPDLFVEHIVEVFRAVRRVLRDDGTLWVNMGSSYAGSGKGPTGHNGIGDQAKRQGFVGGDGKNPNRTRLPQHGSEYGTDGTERPGWPGLDCAYPYLCDECLADLSRHIADTNRQPAAAPLPGDSTSRGKSRPGCASVAAGDVPLAAQSSTTIESWLQSRGECSRCASRGALYQSLPLPSSGDAQQFARMAEYMSGNDQSASGARSQGKDVSGLAQGYFTSPARIYKPKDLIDVPGMVAEALRADGWYLRSQIPWLKKSAMPESVTDRPASAVEYVYLFSKSSKYFYDADAVRMPHADSNTSRLAAKKRHGTTVSDDLTKVATGKERTNGWFYKGLPGVGSTLGGFDPAGRSRRNSDWFFESWQGLLHDEQDEPLALVVNPAGYSGAHFATWPTKLVEPMVKASTSEKGACSATVMKLRVRSDLTAEQRERVDAWLRRRRG